MFRNKGKKFDIQEGEVTAIKKDKVKVCEAGKLVQKEKSEVPTPYKIGCNGETIRSTFEDNMFFFCPVIEN